jgi:hypothetical protein
LFEYKELQYFRKPNKNHTFLGEGDREEK